MNKAQIELDVAAECGLALQQAGRPALNGVRIKNTGEETLVGLTLTVSSDVGLFHPLALGIDAIQAGEEISVPIPEGQPSLDYAFLSQLTDVREGTVRAALTDAAGAEIAFVERHQTTYAPGQTFGCGRPIFYASFVVPNSDAVAHVENAVAKALEAETGSASITGYLNGKQGAYNLCKATYKAIQGLGLTYSVCPASFGQPGEKVRLPDEILQFKTGCCLDTTLLFAAVFEKCALRPVIVLQKGHAFVGCHLTDESFPEPIITDAEVLRKAIQEDRFAVLETTQVGGDGLFADAERSAKASLADDSAFEVAVDVALARAMGIRALPVKPGGGFGEVEGREAHVCKEGTRTLAEDIDLDQVETVKKTQVEARVDGWAQRLLDLSKANRLLNVRDNAKVVPLVCSSPARLEDALAAESSFAVKSFEAYLDEEAARDFQKVDMDAAVETFRPALEKSLDGREIWSVLTKRETERRMKDLFRSARVEMEECGVNTLYLALGVLEWCDAEDGRQKCRAPILLVPVRIERRSVADGYRIRKLDEDPIVNTTLLELLRREYMLAVPGLDPLPMDETGCDVARIFGIFRAAVRNLRGLSVHEDCMVGQFSFGKFVMWNDLTTRLDVIKANPVVAHLISRGGRFDDGVRAFPGAEVDGHFDYAKVCCPLGADSSQLAAILYSELGKSFVLHGPPGTGKSQTITNIIAHNLSLGKRVLFVSEKKAALDVVYGRLSKLGLAPFCLQLHSTKSGKADVYAQFADALRIGSKTPAPDWAAVVKETEQLRRGLDVYVRALHRQTVSGFTPYDLFTRLVRKEISGEGALLAGSAREVTSEQYVQACRMVETAAEMRRGIPSEAVGALQCVKPFAWSPNAETRLAEEMASLADEIAAAVADLASLGGNNAENARFIGRYLMAVKELRELENRLGAEYDLAELRAMRTKVVRQRIVAVEKAFFPVRLLKERSLVREFALIKKSGKADRGSIREIVKLATSLQDADEAVARWEGRAKELLGAGFDPKLADPVERMEARARAENRLETAMKRLGEHLAFDEKDGTEAAIQRAKGVAAQAKGNLRHAFMYFDAKRKIPRIALGLANQLDGEDAPEPKEWARKFADSFQSKLLNEVLESEPVLGTFFGAGREADIARFRELDSKCARLALDNLVARLAANVPANDGKARRGDTSELGLLMHECGKKMRQKPIRQMLMETPTLTPLLKPCFLMSPLSVAQYLPVDARPFDLVVFDEASQIPVWDAIGVIARGQQLIVVGDPKQLPPTNFFQKGINSEAETEDLESVLDECLHAGIMSCFLGWHYRSRHESLIAFSNSRYYENRLHIFPAAQSSDRQGVSFVHVPDGIYEASGSRTNRLEAERVADLVIERMSDPKCAGKSIGVVTFSEAQRDLIEDLIDERRAKHPELEAAFAPDRDEPFFVKNLENVQGDERDAVFFSIGYAPDANGRFNMVFGPLSIQGGERRLNVAITRAREKIIVVSSIHGHQIDTDRVTMQGPKDLRAFLDYAEKGYRIALPCDRAPRDGFAAEVAAVLEGAGAKIARNIGCGGTRVDIAVRDPADGNRYVLGVVCDGAGYAGELTARDRDRLRDDMLKSLGWTVAHVWIVDWALDRTRAEEHLREIYNNAIQRKESNT